MANATKGTALYAIDPDSQELMTLDKLTGLDLGAVTASTTDVKTWGDETSKPLRTGSEVSQASVSLYPDSGNEMHQRLYELANSDDVDGPEMKFALGWSDGKEAPTVDAESSGFTLPETRTFFTFTGWISSFPLDFSGDVVQTQLTIERSNVGEWAAKAVA